MIELIDQQIAKKIAIKIRSEDFYPCSVANKKAKEIRDKNNILKMAAIELLHIIYDDFISPAVDRGEEMCKVGIVGFETKSAFLNGLTLKQQRDALLVCKEYLKYAKYNVEHEICNAGGIYLKITWL